MDDQSIRKLTMNIIDLLQKKANTSRKRASQKRPSKFKKTLFAILELLKQKSKAQ